MSDQEDDGLSVDASISSADTAELTQRIVRAKKQQLHDHGQHQTPPPEPRKALDTPVTKSVPMVRPERGDNAATPLDDISNTCTADDEWSIEGADDETGSVDTATLERRIMERQNKASKPNDPLDDEFVLPDDGSNSSDEEEEVTQSTPTPQRLPTVQQSEDDNELPISNTTASASVQAVSENRPEPAEEIIPRDVSVRLGLHRPPLASARKFRKQPATTLQDDAIEDSSSEDEARFRFASSRKKRASLPLVLPTSQKKKKGPLTQKTLSFTSAVKKKRSFPQQKQSREYAIHGAGRLGPQFSSPPTSHSLAHPVPPQTSTDIPDSYFDRSYPHTADHDFTIVASAYEDSSRYPSHPPMQARQDPSLLIRSTTSIPEARHRQEYSTQNEEHPPIQHQRILNAFRRPDPVGGSFAPDRNQFEQQPMNGSESVERLQPQRHEQHGQPDFAITASAYEDIPYQPHVAPPAVSSRRSGKGGRRIRDPSAHPRRKQGKRRRGRPPAKARQPAKGRRKALANRSQSAAAEQPAFRRAPDDHLNGVGGASIRF